jgi:CBS domain-containing protein
MVCADVMKQDVECISPTEPVSAAAQRMRQCNIGFLPVCAGKGEPILGTLTDRDIALRVVAEKRSFDTTVGEIMSRDVVACRVTDDIKVAEQLMGEREKSRIMCMDDEGRLVGVISLSDIAQRDGARIAYTMQQVTKREAGDARSTGRA